MERKKSALSGFFNAVNALENILLTLMVVGMIVTILLQIGGRVIGHPFPWTEETSRYLFLWMMFVALAAGFNQAESSRVTLLLQIGPKWLKKASEVLYAVMVIGIFVFMIVWGMEVVKQQIMFREMGTALLIPMYFIGICQPVAGVLGIIGTLQSFLEFHGKIAIGDNERKFGINDNFLGTDVFRSAHCRISGYGIHYLYRNHDKPAAFHGSAVHVHFHEQFHHGSSSAVHPLWIPDGRGWCCR